jgi:hypothetical protein
MITAAEQLARADAMEAMPECERDIAIALGVMTNQVIDARHRFDPDRLLPGLDDLFRDAVTTTVFDGTFFPGDGDMA